MRKVFVTGAAGFVGSSFVRHLLKGQEDVFVIAFDALTYAGNLENLKPVEGDKRLLFVKGDIGSPATVTEALNRFPGGPEGVEVVNFAAESHNDRAVLDPGAFFRTNVLGTQALLEACRSVSVGRFHHISTCEVFGDLALDETRAFREDDPFRPRTPYNASKASANHVVMAYHHTFGVPVTVSHCCNNYGPYQFPEKLIPLFVTNALADQPLPLMKSSQNRREWIHVDEHSAAVDLILRRGRVGEAYNIGTGVEKSVEEITDFILGTLGKPATLKTYVADRPGHDRRYLLDSSKIRAELGWTPQVPFEAGLRQTIEWYRDNREWWQRVKDGSYQEYYQKYYGGILGAKG